MNRDQLKARFHAQTEPWDILVIGGGATGVGVAVDAASRGYRVLLVERSDFGKGTSSRSTKLVHGGVRYLEQGNISLVREALAERERLLKNASHLVTVQSFVVPVYTFWGLPFYWFGLKAYDLLAGRHRFGRSRYLSKTEVVTRLPTVQQTGLRGGILYQDGQFDDARLLFNLVRTAHDHGAVLLNYINVTGLIRRDDGTIGGAELRDEETGEKSSAHAKIVINATGAFCDAVREMADATGGNLVAPSQGTHLVLDRSFLPTDHALMVPKTSDGRVLFAIPWHGHALVGTTDVAIPAVAVEPKATDAEIDFLLTTAGQYLVKPPTRDDVKSVFVGIRPLVRSTNQKSTASLSRGHTIHLDESGLLTITGGKWTTYRNMAEDCVNQAVKLAHLPQRPCVTKNLSIHGNDGPPTVTDELAVYGTDRKAIRELQVEDENLSTPLHPNLPYTGAEVVWAARHEAARTVEDVLARRTRALFLDAQAALEMAPWVARLLAQELDRDEAWQLDQVRQFSQVAESYSLGKKIAV